MDLTKISIVTPSFNQGKFIEETIRSVVEQNYPNLEYIIVDGGSTDGTVDCIKNYEKDLTWWVSEADRGQSHALNKGFGKSTGEIMAYLNSDDLYCPWTFKTVASIFCEFPEIDWLTSLRPIIWNVSGEPVINDEKRGFTRHAFYSGRTLGCSEKHIGWIMQEATFWRRSLWEKAGSYILEKFEYAMDFELWARFYEHSELVGICVPLGGYRLHGQQKSADLEKYYEEAQSVLEDYNDKTFHKNGLKSRPNKCWIISYDLQEKKRVLNKWGGRYLDEINSLREGIKNIRKELLQKDNELRLIYGSLPYKIMRPLIRVKNIFK
jgi:glycosyltransferase involved in cell wall biosynthesis